MADISKEELKKEIAKILKNANLAETSTKKVRQKLEKSFGVDLGEKRKLIDQLVMDYVNNKDDDDEEVEEEEEEEKKPKKRAAAASKGSSKKAKKNISEDEESEEEEEEESESESDSEDEKKKRAAKKKGRKKKVSDDDSDSDRGKKKSKAKKGGGRGKGGGYTRAYKLSPVLAELMGQEEMPRHEVVRRVWAIIKERELFDPNNKQFAICDDALYKVFGTKRFRTFGMMKYLKSHFLDE